MGSRNAAEARYLISRSLPLQVVHLYKPLVEKWLLTKDRLLECEEDNTDVKVSVVDET